MSQQNTDPKKLTTGICRFSFVHLTAPRSTVPGGTPKYSVTLLIPKSDFATKQKIDTAIQAAIAEGVNTKWNGQRPAQPAIPLYDGDGLRPTGEAFGPECKGHWVMTASCEQRPGIVDLQVMPIIDANQIYSGMYGRAAIRFFAYFNSGKKGIGCGLNNVQKTADGDPLSARSTPEDDFSAPWNSPTSVPQQASYAAPIAQPHKANEQSYIPSYTAPAAPIIPNQQPYQQAPVLPNPQPYAQAPGTSVQAYHGIPTQAYAPSPVATQQPYATAGAPVYGIEPNR